jgi:hypothetical protein
MYGYIYMRNELIVYSGTVKSNEVINTFVCGEVPSQSISISEVSNE